MQNVSRHLNPNGKPGALMLRAGTPKPDVNAVMHWEEHNSLISDTLDNALDCHTIKSTSTIKVPAKRLSKALQHPIECYACRPVMALHAELSPVVRHVHTYSPDSHPRIPVIPGRCAVF